MWYLAYVCCHPSDAAVARQLCRWLGHFRPPRRLVGRKTATGEVPPRLHPLFGPAAAVDDGSPVSSDFQAALAASKTLLVLCSPSSARSVTINEQILTFKRLGRGASILCLVVDGEPNASDRADIASSECFAPALRYRLGPDGTLSHERAEPIAADMRPGKDGRRDAWLKIAAGIAGVGFDELKQRALQRRLRILSAIAAVAGGVLVAAACLTVLAVMSQWKAAAQREAAVVAEKRAQDARDEAEISRVFAEARRDQSRLAVDSLFNAFGSVCSPNDALLGPRMRAAVLLKIMETALTQSTGKPASPAGVTSLVAIARSMNGLLQHEMALQCLTAASAMLEAVRKEGSSAAVGKDILNAVEASIDVERAAALVALQRYDEAAAEIERFEQAAVARIAEEDPSRLRSDLLSAVLERERGHGERARTGLESVLRRLPANAATSRGIAADALVALVKTELNLGNLQAAEQTLRELLVHDVSAESRSGRLHELLGLLARKHVEDGNAQAAISLLQESLEIARRTDGVPLAHLIPQMLVLADLSAVAEPALARRYREDAIELGIRHVSRLCDPAISERNAEAYRSQVREAMPMTQVLGEALQLTVDQKYLATEGPGVVHAFAKCLERQAAYLDHVVMEVNRIKGDFANGDKAISDLTQGAKSVRQIGSAISNLANLALTNCDALAPPQTVVDASSPTGVLVNSLGMKLVPIEPGEFLMGSPADEPLGNPLEERQHIVVLTRPFLIGMHEVTQAQYEKVTGKNPSVFKGEDRPVEHLSWAEATEFCNRLGQLPAEIDAGRRYRLPTEAEWEYCCRAGTTTPYHTGNRLTPSQGRYAFVERLEPKQTAPVGTYPPNAWGLHDMHGNVWEWTGDWFSVEYYGKTPRAVDPAGPANGTHHTLRGGSASVLPEFCHAAFRGEAEADAPDAAKTAAQFARLGDFGLRVVCETAPPVGKDPQVSP